MFLGLFFLSFFFGCLVSFLGDAPSRGQYETGQAECLGAIQLIREGLGSDAVGLSSRNTTRSGGRAVVEYECTALLDSAAEDAGNCNVMAAKGSAALCEHRGVVGLPCQAPEGNEGSLFRTGPSPVPPPAPFCPGGSWVSRVPQRGGESWSRPFPPAFLVPPNPAQALWGGAYATSRPCVPGSCLGHAVHSVPGCTRLMQCKRNLERTSLSVPTPPHPTAPHLQPAAAAPDSGHLPCLGQSPAAICTPSHPRRLLPHCLTVLCFPAPVQRLLDVLGVAVWNQPCRQGGHDTAVPSLFASTGLGRGSRAGNGPFWLAWVLDLWCAVGALCCWRLHLYPRHPVSHRQVQASPRTKIGPSARLGLGRYSGTRRQTRLL